MLLSTGQILQNRYRVVKLLAQGGFGSVYRAWDIRLNMPVALKESLDTSPQATRQFSQEAKLLSNLSHPNLPRVLDFFAIPGQGLYLVMEFIQGQDLEECLDAAQGPLAEAQVLPWVMQICDALTYLHTRTPPIIHRDIKPANIRITPDGHAYLVDFGIAKQYNPDARTITGARAVTPGYAPFEQYGQRSTDARSDIYALGATLYHLLSGQKPPESLDRVSVDRLFPPRQFSPHIHPGIETAILRAMQVLPEQRYQSITDFKRMLLNPLEPAVQVAPTVSAPDLSPVAATMRAAGPPPAYSALPSASPAARPIEPAARLAVPPAARQQAYQPSISRSKAWLAGAALGMILLLAVIALGVVYLAGSRDDLSPSQTALSETRAALAERPTATASPIPPTLTQTTAPTATLLPSATPPPSQTPLPSLTSVPTLELSPTSALPEGFFQDAQGIPMRLIAAGNFWMGNDADAWPSRPMHTVYLDAYYLDVYEVTNAAYAQCVAAGVCALPFRTKSNTRQTYYGDPTFDRYPVVQVNWAMAQQFCQWRGARLPTEAEWEKGARGDSDQRTYPWGEETVINCVLTNYKSCGLEDTDSVDSHPTGVSPYGLFDMAGNVREWVADWYAIEYYRIAPTQNPPGPASGSTRVTRGGSWQDTSNFLRLYYRLDVDPAGYSYWVGFRCARSLP